MDAIKVPDSTFPVQSYRVIALYWTPEPRTLEPFSQTKLEKNNNYLIYRFKIGNVSSEVFAGYRYLKIDYEKQPVTLKVDVFGPFFGIGWEF